MALSNSQVIDRALQKIGYLAAGEEAQAEDAQSALDLLNGLMAQWAQDSMDLHFAPQDTLSDICPIPDYAELGVISGLALHCESDFRSQLTPQSRRMCEMDVQKLANVIINQNLEGADMSHLPQGEGSGRWDINRNRFN